ncbi:zinc-dependent alcohol dehydrogenase family protein [Rickettsia endosymbiont of Orchestes rusci]|uniref:zinc-dependent alcohol dehydrogenase family protein n=1 Tax=Rickettsia endosymbiont of Orchestes rusci TaxID=3066250 RepID=UPI00313F2E07
MKYSKTIKNFIPQKYKAVIYEEFGNPSSVLKVVEVNRPELRAGEILVQMKLCSINYSDLLTIQGVYKSRVSLPKIPGFEGIGVVKDIGDDRDSYLLGARVLPLKGQGTWQEYNIASSQEVICIPKEINDQTAAQLYINPLTVWLMLTEELKFTKGKTLAINAGNSACGYIIAKLAQLFEYNLISIVRKNDYITKLKEIGASLVINTTEEDFKNVILEYTNGKGVDYALDAIGGKDGELLAECVNNGGVMLNYGLLSGTPLPSSCYSNSSYRHVTIKPYFLREWMYNEEINYRKNIIQEMIKAFVKLKIVLPVEKEYTIDNVTKAVEAAQASRQNGKI